MYFTITDPAKAIFDIDDYQTAIRELVRAAFVLINIQSFDRDRDCFSDEKELLKNDAEHLPNFYSLTGESRKEYIIKMAEAEAERIRIVRRAQAEGILAIHQAEAEGFRRITEKSRIFFLALICRRLGMTLAADMCAACRT